MTRILLSIFFSSFTALTCRGAEPAFQYIGPPSPELSVTNRAYTGVPSLAVSPRGRLWATWYAGHTPAEDSNNYVVLATSSDGGKSWKEILIVDPDGDGVRRVCDPELWIAPDGKLRWFWSERRIPNMPDKLWMILVDDPEKENPKWHPPIYITDGIMMCKPIVLSTGEWTLPVSVRAVEGSSKMVVSSDEGQSWSVRGACTIPKKFRECDEQMFIERKDGSIWLLARTKYGIGESVSIDRGKTWPELTPSAISHSNARFFISRLNSGNLLLVKHGPIEKK